MVNGDLSKMVEEELQRRGGYVNLEAGLMKPGEGLSNSKKVPPKLDEVKWVTQISALDRNPYAQSCCFLCTSSLMRWIVILVGLSLGLYLYSNSVWNGWAPPNKETDRLLEQNLHVEDKAPSDPSAGPEEVKLVVEDEVQDNPKLEDPIGEITSSVQSDVEPVKMPSHNPINNLPALSDAKPVGDTDLDSTAPADSESEGAAESHSLEDDTQVESAPHSALVAANQSLPAETTSEVTPEVSDDQESSAKTTAKLAAAPKIQADEAKSALILVTPGSDSEEEGVIEASEVVAQPTNDHSSESSASKIIDSTLDLRRPGGAALFEHS